MLYCLFYYRGLGLVVVSSLFVAAIITYALVLLLSKTAGFTLTLPGIAGLIIAVGVTADSFVIFFERIRDEMREASRCGSRSRPAGPEPGHPGRGQHGADPLRAGALHLRHRRREGLRLRARPHHADRPRGAVLVHQADGVLARAVQGVQLRHKLSGLSKETLGMDITPSRPRRPAVAGGDA